MNFLKKTASAISNGIELESLKSERAKLKKEIEKLQTKCNTYNQQIELKNTLNEFMGQINASFDVLVQFEKNNFDKINLTKGVEPVKSVQSAQPSQTVKQTQPTQSDKKDKKDDEESDDEDVVVEEIEEDPNSFESIQKNLNIVLNKNQEDIKSLNKSREEFKVLLDKLNLILADGVEKHQVEIIKKQGRIDKINEKLKVLRGKK